MRQSSFVLLLVMALGLNGCATIRTMPTLASPGSPKVYSGARLDYNAVTNDGEDLGKFKTAAPAYPLIDLPFSMVLDTIILFVTIPVATYEVVFEP